MNENDKRAFMAWYLDFGFAGDSSQQEEVWQAALAHREAEIEALKHDLEVYMKIANEAAAKESQPLVRLTDEELDSAFSEADKWCMNERRFCVHFGNAIMDVLEAKNRRNV